MSLLISGLKLPLKVIVWLVGSKRKRPQKTELEQKCRQHVRNFAPTHYSWQIRVGKKLTKKRGKNITTRKEKKNKKLIKSVNKGYYEKQPKKAF